jgi:pimeloyl-ACP methyl ester carboxylesterase
VDALLVRLSRWISRRAKLVAAVWLAIIAGGAWFAIHQQDHLTGGGWEVPGSQALRANDLIASFNGYSVAGLVVVVSTPQKPRRVRAVVDQKRFLAGLCCAPPKTLAEAFGVPPSALLTKMDNEISNPGFLQRELANAQPPGPSNDFFAMGKTLSNLCADVIPFQSAQARRLVEGLPPEWQALARDEDALQPINRFACEVWRVPRSSPRQRDPVVSSVPTLILVSEWDHVIWPGEGRQIAKSLSNVHIYELPGLDHNALLNLRAQDISCPRTIVTSFLGRPSAAPKAGCIASMAEPPLAPPR